MNNQSTYIFSPTAGFILLTVMVYLLILSLLALNTLEGSVLQTRMNNNLRDNNILFVCAQAALQQIKNYLLLQHVPQKCLLTEQASNYYRNKNATWWQTYACKINICKKCHIFYFVENLTELPCYKINGYKVGAKYYRLTARASYADNNYQTILQANILLPFATTAVCPAEKIKVVTGGQQSWREFY